MRRRLFWTIAGVAAFTGLLVLGATVFAYQRAAVDATYRELRTSADEAVSLIDDLLETEGRRRAAVLEIIQLLQGTELNTNFARIRRTAGGSEIGVAVVGTDGQLLYKAELFDRVDLKGQTFKTGHAYSKVSYEDELVVVTPTITQLAGGGEVTLLVALAREAPIFRLSDQMPALVLIVAGIAILAGVGARLLSEQLTSQLEPLAEASRSVAAGDMTARVPDIGDPDLDQVAMAFNDMASELEMARQREREFILGVGHDLRTPLTTIGGYAEALEAGELSEEELARIGGVLGFQSRQLGRLIDDLSTLARLEQAEFGLRSEQVDVGAHVSEVIEGFERRASELGVKVTVEATSGIYLDTDPDRLGQIAQNLMENALRHTPEAGSIRVTVTEDGDQVVIAVADTGVGISEEDLPFVFDRHFVGRKRSIHREGTGLGLSIVKGLVDRMGGTVEASSRPGKGTTITVRISR